MKVVFLMQEKLNFTSIKTSVRLGTTNAAWLDRELLRAFRSMDGSAITGELRNQENQHQQLKPV